jgi:hypothetical protein
VAIDAVLLRFLQGLIHSPRDKQLSTVARRCSDEFRIGTRVGRRFVYDEKDIADATVLLQSNGLPLASTEIQDRADAAARPGITEKHATTAPHDDSVAHRIFRLGTPQSVGYGVASATEVSQLSAGMMMVVENFETFRQLHRYTWVMERLMDIECCIVVFRGDNIYSVGDAKRCVNSSILPKIGFHDFDPAGLYMSASLPGLIEHLMPKVSVLEPAMAEGKRSDLYFSQFAQFSNELGKATLANIPDAWKLMRRLQKGLPQEWMRDLA